MTDLIFAIPRTRYDSYSDYLRLLEAAGVQVCTVDQIDVTRDAVYVVTPINGEFRPHIDNQRHLPKRAKICWYNLERPIEVEWADLAQDSKPVYATTVARLDTLPNYVDEMWVADRSFARALQSPRIRFVPMGSEEKLRDFSVKRNGAFDYDFAHLSYLVHRRSLIYDRLCDLRCMPNAWPPERERLLARTRLMLNVHQTDHQISEPLRFAIAAANKIPLVSETMTDPWPMVRDTHYLEFAHDQIADGARAAMGMNLNGEALHHLLCHEYTFTRNMNDAFHAVLGS